MIWTVVETQTALERQVWEPQKKRNRSRGLELAQTGCTATTEVGREAPLYDEKIRYTPIYLIKLYSFF